MRSPLRFLLVAAFYFAALPVAARAVTCTGDCDGNGMVDESDVDTVIAAVFDPQPDDICADLVASGDAASAASLVEAVGFIGFNCVASSPPTIPVHDVYRTFSGNDIALPIAAEATDANALEYSADMLPTGAMVTPDTGILNWNPTPDQIGPFYINIHATDLGWPPSTSSSQIAFRVTPLDTCTIPTCDPATGCTGTLPPLTQTCCTAAGPVTRTAEAVFQCPQGQVLMIGRNQDTGFGRLENCDYLQLIRPTQSSVTIKLNYAALCISTGSDVIDAHIHMESNDMILVERHDTITMQQTSTAFSQYLHDRVPVPMAMPALEGQEANLTVTLTDPLTNIAVTETVRVILTHTTLPDIPDVF